jgi:hypothetical protein
MDWLYMHWENGGYEELYDLQNDPQQLHNVANLPSGAATRHELRSALIDWLRAWGDPAWELDAQGDLIEQEYTGRKVRRWQPRPNGQTPQHFSDPPKLWSKEDDWWPWRWRAVNGDYHSLFELAKKIHDRTQQGGEGKK